MICSAYSCPAILGVTVLKLTHSWLVFYSEL